MLLVRDHCLAPARRACASTSLEPSPGFTLPGGARAVSQQSPIAGVRAVVEGSLWVSDKAPPRRAGSGGGLTQQGSSCPECGLREPAEISDQGLGAFAVSSASLHGWVW